ncbi:CRISPR-associated ring nuclease Csm6 [Geomonas subterranea]|uniref:CRISPR-associated ring nuclease Csm6 n=1 Tax=Geomonas subterranea TaxID=2847989 RepID=UPI001CD650DB|nr:CRISPR-associated ring nuclease Csm6 [Geomonas fuzhouensis]
MGGHFQEIFVFVAGGTPQIITETIYALAQQSPPVYPDQLYVITTAPGKRRAQETLVADGILAQLCREYDIPTVLLEDDSFIVLTDMEGRELLDIRTVEANETAGDQVTCILRRLSAQPNCRLHCTLSGGRRSMSYFMGVAFQLFARQWDKLYHVLVSPEFEENSGFFYKPRVDRQIEGYSRDGESRVLNTRDAEVSLVELPLIFLRDKFSVSGGGVRDMVAQGQKHIDTATVQLHVRVDFAERCIYIGKTAIELLPTQLMIYTTFLRRKHSNRCSSSRTHCYECNSCFVLLGDLADRQALEDMVLDYERMYISNPFKKDELLEKWEYGLDIDLLRQHISKINRAIKEQLNDATLLPFYKIDSIKHYGKGRYGVRVEKEKISIT